MNHRQLNILVGLAAFALVLFVVPIAPDQPLVRRTLAVGVLMGILWITEAIPLAVTALIPVAIFPVLGVMKGNAVAPLYLNNILFLFIGGFMIALAMERWNLHRRVALKVVLAIGSSPTRILLGFMTASWALSMWVSNTATTMMMVPIALALTIKLEESTGGLSRKFQVGVLLGIAYASSIGGMATLIGTAPNLSFARIYGISFPEAPEITFLFWMGVGLPVSVALGAVAFLVLRSMFTRRLVFDVDRTVLQQEYKALGRASFEERAVLIAFATMAVLLVTRSGLQIGDVMLPGWGSWFPDATFIDDGTVAITIALCLFMIPARNGEGFVMDAGIIPKLPWDILILLGGGFALARGFQESGASAYLGGKLAGLEGLHPVVMVLAVCALITFLTELTSNTATTQVMLPIIASLSTVVDVPPLVLMVPATIAASCAFMLPVATPPNAIVFGTHRIPIREMAAVGLRLNLISIVVIALIVYALGLVMF